MTEGFIIGELTGDRNDKLEIAFRSQVAKPNNLSDPDRWMPWDTIAARPGRFQVRLDRGDAAAGKSSLHGVYRWQLRINLAESDASLASGGGEQVVAGLRSLRMLGYFENGIMSIPQIFDGRNTVRFKVEDPSLVQGEIMVTYRWQTAGGEREHNQRIVPGEMFYRDNEAVYTIDAPGLIRCNSLTISYE